ncbi:MAG: hypothetical protein ACKOX3_12410 [Bacteroidota bacterium]
MLIASMNMLPAKAEKLNQGTTCIRPPKIHIVIVFGKPKYDCEVYPGMCVFLYGTFDRSNPLSAGTYTSYEDHVLQIEIQKNEMNEALSKQLQEHNIFDLDESFEIPDDISRDLGSEEGITLLPGHYEIQELENAYILTIGCR